MVTNDAASHPVSMGAATPVPATLPSASPDSPSLVEHRKARRGAVPYGNIAVVIALLLCLYVFSMVPVARLYRYRVASSGLLGNPVPIRVDERIAYSLYYPLIYISSQNELAYMLTEKYNEIWSSMIPVHLDSNSWWRIRILNQYFASLKKELKAGASFPDAYEAVDEKTPEFMKRCIKENINP